MIDFMDEVEKRRGNAMALRTAGWIGLIVAAAAGCRRDPHLDVYLDALSAEKRMLEDRIYELERKVDQAEAEIRRLRGDAAKGARDGDRAPRGAPEDGPIEELPPPKVDLLPGRSDKGEPSDDESMPGDLRPPVIEPGEPQPVPKPGKGASSRTRRDRTVSSTLRRGAGGLGSGLAAAGPAPAGRRRAVSIAVDPQHTRGVNRDGRPGDDGLKLTLVPTDASGQFVPEAAPVVVELYEEADPSEPLARWEFTADETALSLHKADVGRGIRLLMKLPPIERRHRRHRLHILYDPEGPKPLEAEYPLDLEPHIPSTAAPSTGRWTPRAGKS